MDSILTVTSPTRCPRSSAALNLAVHPSVLPDRTCLFVISNRLSVTSSGARSARASPPQPALLAPGCLLNMSSPTHPFASPNAIPPRTSSTGILNGNSIKHRTSVLRPLSEIDWLGQSKKSKTFHSADPLNTDLQPSNPESSQQTHYQTDSNAMDVRSSVTPPCEPTTNYPTPLSPPQEHTKGFGENLIYGNSASWTEEKERILLGPYDYLEAHPGKDIRSQCIAAFNLWLHVPPKRLEVITRVVAMLHTSSLLYVYNAHIPKTRNASRHLRFSVEGVEGD